MAAHVWAYGYPTEEIDWAKLSSLSSFRTGMSSGSFDNNKMFNAPR